MKNLNFFTKKEKPDFNPTSDDLNSLLEAFTNYEHSWHLDRKVPIAFLIALIIQTGALVWWAATTESRIEHIEQVAVKQSWSRVVDIRLQEIEKDLIAQEKESATQADLINLDSLVARSLINHESQIKDVSLKLDTLNVKLDRFIFQKIFDPGTQ